jgi:predicted Na+-dependent transporter
MLPILLIWTAVAGGDIALALVVVTADTLLSPVVLPISIALVTGQTVQVDYPKMMVGLMWMVAVPSILGMALNDIFRGKFREFTASLGGFSAKLALFVVVVINAALIAPEVPGT